jgi:magnesium chelatase subunit I
MPDNVAFPLTALVGQDEVKDALLLAAVNPRVQGVLLIGGKGTGKTTAVRGLLPLLPEIEHSTCAFGCDPSHALTHPEELCDSCRAKLALGEAISYRDTQKVVELPLNATLDDVVGGASARAGIEQQRLRFEPGLLAHAHRNILYIDEINLLDEAIVDAILDAAATGYCVVRRGRLAASYPAEFVLIGSMNPEEGALRPQIMDRIGLRVNVAPRTSPDERLEIAQRVRRYRSDPPGFLSTYEPQTSRAAESIQRAREALKQTDLTPEAERLAVSLTLELGVGSHRAEIVLMEAARAYASLEGRELANVDDVKAVALLVLRHRRSDLTDFERTAREEDEQITAAIGRVAPSNPAKSDQARANGRKSAPTASRSARTGSTK